ncbi:MAG: DNA gyrase inhibitor YacG [Albidovulum sp.]
MACPICHKDTDIKYRPFCSKRCADVDLGRWLGGHYVIPSQDPDEAEEALQEIAKAATKPH